MADLVEPPKKRALPFKRTVPRKQLSAIAAEKTDDDSDLDLFRHSQEVFPEILREVQEDQKEHDRKRRKTSPDGASSQRRRELSAGSPHAAAYPRKASAAMEESDDDLIMDVKGKGKEIIGTRTRSAPRTPVSASATPRTPSSKRGTQIPASGRASRKSHGSPGVPITVLDDGSDYDDGAQTLGSSSSKPRRSSERLNPRRQNPRSNDDNDVPVEILPGPKETEVEEVAPAAEQPDEFSEWVAKAREMQAQQSQQAVVKLFMVSQLPGAAPPILVKRRLNQGVQLLLDVWVANARAKGVEIPDDVASRLFLTWKGNKIYSHSTLASLGVQVDAQGNLEGHDGEGYHRDGLLLEVWTEEAYAAYMEERGRKRGLILGPEDDLRLAAASGEEPSSPPPPVQQQPPRRKGIKIVLKAKEHEPLKLTGKDDTTVEALIEAFRAQRSIGPEWDVAIYFDGERLDQECMIADIDVDPDEANQLEVHIKKANR
ncbi:uncharacterized protein THITE_2115919 [Thermothielavioides terrestris NRRL 8126]|uniref:Rad60/SUMO-like domain-containing protein n=1 Tax=Thermothielavioides terrestris (strain ATCC 38088 / NRRL 8126) TaxID=578455 RepID=G2QYX0_THETT|nr:uncharacterized protein THITE_2115919 [Thermothielavioides terrestris NRRL 8126]AEO67109.1 hypothetical protein THITE_2115919 [Thermothielavioides terrestris NRRL 8126]